MDKDYQKSYYEKNRERILARKKNRYEQTKVVVRKSLTEEERRAYRNDYYKNRRKSDPSFKLRTSISANINFYPPSQEDPRLKARDELRTEYLQFF